MNKPPEPPRWLTLEEALTAFASTTDRTQSQRHIKPLHWYVACRLVIEGGYHPDCIVPRPPFVVTSCGGRFVLRHDPAAAVHGEQTILGGLKTKNVDIVVLIEGVGPCVAVSMKGTLNAFRNLTNRMEEAVGDCTNLHIAYPALVYAFWNVLRANREGLVHTGSPAFLKPDSRGRYRREDVAILRDGSPVQSIMRYHFALKGLTGRDSIRQQPSLYEAVGMTLVDVLPGHIAEVYRDYPPKDSPLLMNRMFETIYRQYDQRFLYQAPALKHRTQRLEWDPNSPVLKELSRFDYDARIAAAGSKDASSANG